MLREIAIIGSAGRREDFKKWNSIVYFQLVKEIEQRIFRTSLFGNDWTSVALVSGGAAWADHIAVELLKNFYTREVKLFLPCEWNFKKQQFVDTGERNFITNPGGTANFHHRKFSQVINKNSLVDIQEGMLNDCIDAKVVFGFKNRNLEIAKAKYLIAATWSDVPKDGGTAHTWEHSTASVKYHINLTTRAPLYQIFFNLKGMYNIGWYIKDGGFSFLKDGRWLLTEDVMNLLSEEELDNFIRCLDLFN